MFRIKRQDIVQVIKGRDKGKKGKVLQVVFEGKRALVEGINIVKKHTRQTRQDQKGGIIEIEAPICLANIMLFCKNCNSPSRVKIKKAADGTKSRVCKKCQGPI